LERVGRARPDQDQWLGMRWRDSSPRLELVKFVFLIDQAGSWFDALFDMTKVMARLASKG
jgi:hypothetical protein